LRGKNSKCGVLWSFVALISVHVGVQGLGSFGCIGEGGASGGEASVEVIFCFNFV
jgi:hypothetical protein